MPNDRHPVTLLLEKVNAGDPTAESALLELVYEELREMAAARMAGLGAGQTLQATALVNEAYMKLAPRDGSWEGRAHFFGAAGRAMRNIIVDQYRRKDTARHGGDRQRVPLDTSIATTNPGDPEQVIAIEEALRRLEQEEPRAAQVVDLRYFVGLSDQATADAMGISLRTVYREWSYAKAWLRRELEDPQLMEPAP